MPRLLAVCLLDILLSATSNNWAAHLCPAPCFLTAVSAQQAGDASDARRLAAEVDRLNQRINSLGAELDSTQQQLADARDQVSAMQRLQSSNGRRMVELEGDASDLAQQLTVGAAALAGNWLLLVYTRGGVCLTCLYQSALRCQANGVYTIVCINMG